MSDLNNFKVYSSNSQIRIVYDLPNVAELLLNMINIMCQSVYSMKNISQNAGNHIIPLKPEEFRDQSKTYIIQ
ncbi:MAG: hypothetical protein ISR55_07115 [Bacteroidetes bacterium]|nr:hypothetical protein [Bacteroidota bacterium]MBL6963574.1 hypothetical protein [Bacteroidota bacterium]